MLREAWHGISYIYVCKASRTCPLRLAKPLGMFRPKFHWEPGFSHWNALPAQWQVNTDTHYNTLAVTQEIPDIPRPRWTALTADAASTAAPEGSAASTAFPDGQSASTAAIHQLLRECLHLLQLLQLHRILECKPACTIGSMLKHK